jgi:multicomponent K+:H+ antiporter subunit G
MNFWLELTITLFLVLGGVFLLVGSIGLWRLPDIFTRLHGPTKATTLGISSVLFGSMVFQSYHQGSLSVNEWLITLFLFISAPVAANMIAKVALHHENDPGARTKGQQLMAKAKNRQPPE